MGALGGTCVGQLAAGLQAWVVATPPLRQLGAACWQGTSYWQLQLKLPSATCAEMPRLSQRLADSQSARPPRISAMTWQEHRVETQVCLLAGGDECVTARPQSGASIAAGSWADTGARPSTAGWSAGRRSLPAPHTPPHPRRLWVLLHRRPPGLQPGPPAKHGGPSKVLGQDLCSGVGRVGVGWGVGR